jgi:hypothetical protein
LLIIHIHIGATLQEPAKLADALAKTVIAVAHAHTTIDGVAQPAPVVVRVDNSAVTQQVTTASYELLFAGAGPVVLISRLLVGPTVYA